MYFRLILFIFFIIYSFSSYSQTGILKGKIQSEKGEALENASVTILATTLLTVSDKNGNYSLQVPSGKEFVCLIQILGYKQSSFTFNLKEGEQLEKNIFLISEIGQLKEVEITSQKDETKRIEISTIQVDPKNAKYLPSAFGDFNKILQTLPGVGGNNELSSQYTVRGGNFDENLVYVNDIEVYRPFLVRSGQQEGLSFINPDLVSEINFSAGGWQPRYGDKLSSVLAIKYKEPKKFKGSVSLGLLSNAVHFENGTKNQRVSFIIGARQKNSQYLLNTLQTKGEYKPRFYDVQSYINFDLTKRRSATDREKRTTLGVLLSYANNDYRVTPKTRQTTFGTGTDILQLKVAFDGRELLEYESYQSGLKLLHKFSNRFRSDLIASGLYTQERENFDIESGYRLCDIDMDPNSSSFNQCVSMQGLGTIFDHARNKLQASVFNFKNNSYYTLNKKNKFEFGLVYGIEKINDALSEYSFIDSAGYVTLTKPTIDAQNNLNSQRMQGYVQHTYEADSVHSLTYGVRLNYWTLNKQLLVSPRLQYAYKPNWKSDIIFKLGIGVYQQPEFYRELRNQQGVVNRNLKAQCSYHFIAGSDLNFRMGDRGFKFISELYYKYLTNVVPYDIENVRLRYYATNNAVAYVAGADFRVSGEFIKGTESWFSLGLLSTKENVDGDGVGYIRRPTDQRVTASIFFQDHLPNNPTIKMYLNLIYGSGLPFGPPNGGKYRDAFSGPAYRRVDIGFSKLLSFQDKEVLKNYPLESLWLSVEILNVIGVSNTISYLWITDVSNRQYAIPNTLSARFLNIRLIGKF